MRSVVVVEVQIRNEPLSAFIGARVQQRLDETLDLPVGSRRVRSGTFVLDAGIAAEPPELSADEGRSVVGHDPLDVDLERSEPAHSVFRNVHAASLRSSAWISA